MTTKNKLFQAINETTNETITTNGMVSYKSTLSDCLDLFTTGATYRSNPEGFRDLFRKAYLEDKLTSVRILFYFRDIRGNSGQGERLIFREGLKELITIDPINAKYVLKHVPMYGRWDDLINLYGFSKKTDKTISKLITDQFTKDIKAVAKDEEISLLGKWLPSCNTSSKETRTLAKTIRTDVLKLDERTYRKVLSLLRKTIKIVETNLTQKDYTFNYSNLPGKASLQYRKAFMRNDQERYSKYLEDLAEAILNKTTDIKVNAKTLYPYDLVKKYLKGDSPSISENSLYDSMWRSLPDYFNDNKANWLAVVDVSGSMTSDDYQPMAVSVSLGLYIAERNHGIFKNKYITFSKEPYLIEIDPSWALKEKIRHTCRKGVGYNTNLIKVFEVILNSALEHELDKTEMPEAIVIISDMQFDSQINDFNISSINHIKSMYIDSGYVMPKIVYWNAASSNHGNVPATMFEDQVVMLNGCKPGMFDMLLSGRNPVDMLRLLVNSDRYNIINFK